MRRPNVTPEWEGERRPVELSNFMATADSLCRSIAKTDPERRSAALIELIDIEDDDAPAQAAWLAKWFPTLAD